MPKKVPNDKKRTYQNGTYVRVTVFPETREIIRKKAKKSKKKMVEWIDDAVKEKND